MSEGRPSARRCSMCGLSFPNDEEETWKECARCGEPTDVIVGGGPNITDEEATKVLRAREFEEYLEEQGIK